MDLNGKCVLLGVSGGIAAYKMANVASALRKLGADVEVIMTKNATQFITPVTFETLTGHKCMVDTFDRDFKFEVTHISLAKKADVILVAPATANVIAKMAHGIADDMLTTTVLAAKCPKLVSLGKTPLGKKIVVIIRDVFIILFYVMVTYGGYQLCTRAKQAVSTMPQFTMGQVYTIFPIAGVLCILSAVLNLVVELTTKPEGGESK